MTKNIFTEPCFKWQICFTVIMLFLLSGNCFAQVSTGTTHAEREIIRNAEMEHRVGHFIKSFNLYKQAIALNPQNRYTNFRVGEIYFLSDSAKIKSLPYMRNVIKCSPSVAEDTAISAYYYLAYGYMLNEQYDSAAYCFQKYKAHLGDSNTNRQAYTEIGRQLQICSMAPGIIKRSPDSMAYFLNGKLKQDIQIKKIGDSINTKYPEYAQVLFDGGNTMLFTSRRPTKESPRPDDFTGKYLENMYVSRRDNNGVWSSPFLYSKEIYLDTKNLHTATVFISSNENMLYTYRAGIILVSKKSSGEWSPPQKLSNDIVKTKDWYVPSIFISNDSKILLLVSDEKGGYGGKDIYICRMDNKGNWSDPKNIGPDINTSEDEDAPFLMPDNKTLYFSSKGHGGLGGFDVFVSHYDSAGDKWSTPQNLGVPINSPADDIYFTYGGDNGYLSSSRIGGAGDLDIYSFTCIKKADTAKKLIAKKDTVKDTVKNVSTTAALPHCVIYFQLAKSSIDKKYYPILDSIAAIMKANKEIKIRIGGFTDNIGNEKYNMELSLLRASSVAKYLFKKDIEFERVIYKGYGDTQFAAPNDGVHNYLNRRAEVEKL